METASCAKFRKILQDELVARCRNNKNYSIRAFARSLDLDFSVLSKLLRGDRQAGSRLIQRLSGKLGLTEAQVNSLVRATAAPLSTAAGAKSVRQPKVRHLSMETFSPISQWYYYALLELSHLPHFQSDPRWIAKVLGLSVVEVSIAIDRLVAAEFLHIDHTGAWMDLSGRNTSILPGRRGHELLRRYQLDMMARATERVTDTSVEQRSNTTMTYAIDTRRLGEARAIIMRFHTEMNSVLSATSGGDEVYALNVNLFPLTKSKGSTKQ